MGSSLLVTRGEPKRPGRRFGAAARRRQLRAERGGAALRGPLRAADPAARGQRGAGVPAPEPRTGLKAWGWGLGGGLLGVGLPCERVSGSTL